MPTIDHFCGVTVRLFSPDDRVSEGAEEAAESALPPADLQAAGGGDERPRAGLSADESLQTDDQGVAELSDV